MKSLSIETRKLIVLAKKRNEKADDISKWLNVSKAVIKKIWSLYNKTGNIEAKVNKGRPSSLIAEIEQSIHDKIHEIPDITLSELIDVLKLPIQKSQLHRWLQKKGYSLKKNSSCEQCSKRGCCRKASEMARLSARLGH